MPTKPADAALLREIADAVDLREDDFMHGWRVVRDRLRALAGMIERIDDGDCVVHRADCNGLSPNARECDCGTYGSGDWPRE